MAASAGRRGDRLFPVQHRAGRDGDRAVAARAHRDDVADRTSCGARPAISSAPAAPALAVWVISRCGYWVAPLTFAPIYLTYRTYKVYMGRIEDEQRHVQQTSDLHLATIEALARAIDAKDQTDQSHIRRVQIYAAGLAEGDRAARRKRSRASRRPRCCTTSASSPCPSTSCRSPGR